MEIAADDASRPMPSDRASVAVEALLRAIHLTEWSMPGSGLALSARYRGDPADYEAWAPGRDDPFTATGLRDPALGNTGPVAFADIEYIAVSARPRHPGAPSDDYAAKFRALAERAMEIAGVDVSSERIVLDRATYR